MKMIRKILAVGVMAILLASTMGYTIERHFCNHCNLHFETTWFLIPGGSEEPAHHCDCEHEHHSGNDKQVCYGSCEVDRAVHVEHVRADIKSFLIEKQIFDFIPTVFLHGNYLIIPNLLNREHNQGLSFIKKPILRFSESVHIDLCIFRL
ncbi:MAG: hypothetical protein ACQES1_02195 [Bacteroidota bacterium]